MTTSDDRRDCGCPEGRQADLSRRTLLRFAGAAGLTTLTLPSGARVAFGAPDGESVSTATTKGPGVVVVLSLRGGFDGLSAVVPLGDPHYATARPNIAVPASRAKQVDSRFGLHPALAPLFPLWEARKLAAVHAVGQASPTRSHFQAMDEMERAAPASALRTGWIDRTLGVLPTLGTFTDTQVGTPNLPAASRGPHPKFAVTSIDSVKTAVSPKLVPPAAWGAALATASAGVRDARVRAQVRQPLTQALKALRTFEPIRAASAAGVSASSAGYPAGQLGSSLHELATLIRTGIGIRVATVDYGDWDMHSGLGRSDGGWMHDHLGELATALAAFAEQLGPDLDRVTLVTLSEFGRRVEENGSGGADHGHGNAVFVLGGGVKGGRVHGRWPGLAPDDLVDGDLAGTTDYRSIVAAVLKKRLGVSTKSVFPGFRPRATGLF